MAGTNKIKNTVGIFLVDYNNRFLLHLRDNKSGLFMSGMWAGFGGTIDYGETPEDAIRRELNEEINFIPPKIQYFKLYNLENRDVYMFVSRIDIKNPSKLNLYEGVAVKYHSLDEIKQLHKNGKTTKEIVFMASEILRELNKSIL